MQNHSLSRRAAVSFLLLMGWGGALLSWSWRKWPDPLVDFGSEIYTAWQLSGGKVLYRDVVCYYGPLAPYVNALCFRLFGPGVLTLAMFNAFLLVLLTGCLYGLMSRITKGWTAFWACAAFLGFFGFNQIVDIGNYNYICPYSHAAVHGMLLGLAAFAAILRFREKNDPWFLVLAGLVTGLTFLTKMECFAASFLTNLLTVAFGGTVRSRRWKTLAFLVLVPVPGMLAFTLFHLAMPASLAWRASVGAWLYVANPLVWRNINFRWISGLDAPALNISLMAAWALAEIAMISLWCWCDRKTGPAPTRPAFLLAVLGSVFLPILGAVLAGPLQYLEAWRGLPILTLGVLAGLWTRGLVYSLERYDPEAQGAMGFAAFALLWLSRMLFHTKSYYYGFVQAMPATLLIIVALIDWIPELLRRHSGSGRVFRAAALTTLGIALAAHLGMTQMYFRRKHVLVGDGRDAFYADSRGVVVNSCLALIRQRIAPTETFIVMTDGIMLNYLSRHESPTRYFEFTPLVLDMYGEAMMRNALSSAAPDYVFLLLRDTSSFGKRDFGKDYGTLLYSWLETNYTPELRLQPPPSQEEPVVPSLWERKSAAKNAEGASSLRRG